MLQYLRLINWIVATFSFKIVVSYFKPEPASRYRWNTMLLFIYIYLKVDFIYILSTSFCSFLLYVAFWFWWSLSRSNETTQFIIFENIFQSPTTSEMLQFKLSLIWQNAPMIKLSVQSRACTKFTLHQIKQIYSGSRYFWIRMNLGLSYIIFQNL